MRGILLLILVIRTQQSTKVSGYEKKPNKMFHDFSIKKCLERILTLPCKNWHAKIKHKRSYACINIKVHCTTMTPLGIKTETLVQQLALCIGPCGWCCFISTNTTFTLPSQNSFYLHTYTRHRSKQKQPKCRRCVQEKSSPPSVKQILSYSLLRKSEERSR